MLRSNPNSPGYSGLVAARVIPSETERMVIGIGRRQFHFFTQRRVALAGPLAARAQIAYPSRSIKIFSFRPHPQASLIYQRALIADDIEKWAKVNRAANNKG